MAATLNFYANPLSPFSQKVHFFLEEIGRPYHYKLVDLKNGEQRSVAFQAVNPFMQVPAIELAGNTLAESGAILRYIAAKWELNDWYPVNLEDRALVDRFIEFTTLHINRPLLDMAWNLHFSPKMMGTVPNMALVEDASRRLQVHLPKLEKHLQTSKFLAGPSLTLADANLLPFAALADYAQVSLADFPAFKEWTLGMTRRPTWAKVQAKLK